MKDRYVICHISNSSMEYYYIKKANSLDIRLLADSLLYLKNTIEIQIQDIDNPVFEDYKRILNAGKIHYEEYHPK